MSEAALEPIVDAFAASLDEGPLQRNPLPRRPLTEDEATMFRAIGNVSYPPGHPHKRFARTADFSSGITDGQAEYLRKIVTRSRRQIPASVVSLAGGSSF